MKIDPDATAAMRRHAESGYPDEVCGVLLGTDAGASLAMPARNRASDRTTRYEIDALDYLRAEARAQACGLRVVGVYHSHPDGTARPSQADLTAARSLWQGHPSFTYVILAVARGELQDVEQWRV